LEHYIDQDIPTEFRGLVRSEFFGWCGVGLLTLWNFVCAVIAKASGIKSYNTGVQDLIFALIYFFALPIGSFVLWYWPLYQAIKKTNSWSFTLFFVFNAAYILFSLVMAAGIPGSGGIGIGTITVLISDGMNVGIFCITANTGLWTASAIYFGIFYRKIYRIYRSTKVMRGGADQTSGKSGFLGNSGGYLKSKTGQFS
jgi:hypothetical protein